MACAVRNARTEGLSAETGGIYSPIKRRRHQRPCSHSSPLKSVIVHACACVCVCDCVCASTQRRAQFSATSAPAESCILYSKCRARTCAALTNPPAPSQCKLPLSREVESSDHAWVSTK
jgi:hypothetical protein